MRVIIGGIIEANNLFNLIEKNDRIAIGVSGGKDSLVMFKALSIFCQKLNKTKNFNVKIKGFLVSLNFKKINYAKLIKWAKKNNLDLQILDSNVSEVLNKKKENNRIQCSLCSKMKKAIIIREMKKQKFNKLALGHHGDDAIETLFMNMLNESRIATIKPISYLDRNKIWMIRPLIFCREKTIIKVSKKLKLPIIHGVCPNEKNTQRTYIKKFIQKNFYESTKWPNAYVNIFRSLKNKKNAYLWFLDSNKF